MKTSKSWLCLLNNLFKIDSVHWKMRRGLNGPKSKPKAERAHHFLKTQEIKGEREDNVPSRPDVRGLYLSVQMSTWRNNFWNHPKAAFLRHTSFSIRMCCVVFVLHLHTYYKLCILYFSCSLVVSYLTSRSMQASKQHITINHIYKINI